ncbi:glycosyltransferase family 4 protein [Roseateles sp.]|uniref:glycosyltransferase family 4 protein n=1 Tax=Roseateles sp. TaxID=1971397 RepID=UPI003BA4C2DB
MARLNDLRLALVGPLPPPAGGMANQVRQLAELLAESGAHVELVQTNAAYRPSWLGRLPVLRALARLLPYLASLWRAAGRNQLMHVLANSGWSWHLFAAPAVWIAYLRGCPVLVNYHGGEAEAFLTRSRGLISFSLSRTGLLTVPSAFLQRVFAAQGFKASIVPNVVDLALFRFRDEGVSTDGDKQIAPHLVVLRNLEPIYDNASALRAFALVRERWPQAQLSVAGSGPELAALQALVTELKLDESVRFCGRLNREGIARLLSEADISLNPSLADNMPVSVLEALACGVPVVSTRVGGIPDLLQDGVSALLVPPADPAALAQAALELIEDAALRQRLREGGRVVVNGCSWALVGPRLAQCYERTLAGAH